MLYSPDAGETSVYDSFAPPRVRYDNALSPGARLLHGEIKDMCRLKGCCRYGNARFSALFETSERTVANWISALKDAGHITVSYGQAGERFLEAVPEDADAAPEEFWRHPVPPHHGTKEKRGEKIFTPGNFFHRMMKFFSKGGENFFTPPKSLPKGVKISSEGDEKNFTAAKSLTEGVKISSKGGENFFIPPKSLPKGVKIFSKESKKIFSSYSSTINEAAATAKSTTDVSGPEKEEAAADVKKQEEQGEPAADGPQKLKAALAALDAELVFTGDFYPRAADFMAENSLGESYLPWLRTYCAERKTRSLNGLFYRLFFAENVAAIFRAQDGPPPSAPPVTAVCPVCGTAHEKRLDKCPACGIARDASRTDTANLKQVYALAPERRDGYLARENKILSSGGVFGDFQKKKARLDALRKEFGLKWEDGGP